MTERVGRIFARIRSYQRKAGTANGVMEFAIEYSLLDGALRSGYLEVAPGAIINERSLADDLKHDIASQLSGKYGVEYRDRDVILAGL